MRILIDIGHPAHIHLYRHFIKKMEERGHMFWVTVKNVADSKKLLERYGIPFVEIGDKSDSMIGKIINQFSYCRILRKLVKKNKIEIGVGSSISISHLSKITGMKSFVFDDDDDEVQPFITYGGHPFCDYLLSPDILKGKRKKKNTIYYPGYHELAYLHPNRFQPDPSVLKDLGLKKGETFFVLRFNAFKAHHDVGVRGISFEQKIQLINMLKKYGKIFITTEDEIEPDFKAYQLKISPEQIHSLLNYAAMFVGDSQTMSSEAAVLGTPAIRCNSFAGRISYLEEEEHKYKLTFGFQPNRFDRMTEKIRELLSKKKLKEVWQDRRRKMLEDKIDVTAFMVWLIDCYPESIDTLKNNPRYVSRFK